uniref:AlNc14C250G9639 protein n=1 Tax=Albugo laibachii Nc14 TaxID=890382 RepID=F0WTG0_9STRA|nr:AlNc14C250G9639 [Albugo laibachii Nc14]|eukprot:CCA24650.1 AlNc14C250G9639 [Albugo laibachii Nc14]
MDFSAPGRTSRIIPHYVPGNSPADLQLGVGLAIAASEKMHPQIEDISAQDGNSRLALGSSSRNPSTKPSQTQADPNSNVPLWELNSLSRIDQTHGPYQSLVTTNVCVIYWKFMNNEHSLSCARCLVRLGEVLIISVKKSYAWIIEGTDPGSIRQCAHCVDLTIESAMKLNVHPVNDKSMRQSHSGCFDRTGSRQGCNIG